MPPRQQASVPDVSPAAVTSAGTTAPADRDVDVVDVTAVLVAHDGAAWLPSALAALAASTARPACVVLVDTGSADASADLLRDADADTVLELPRRTGFGAAVAGALAAAPVRTRWVWLLHDDAAPEAGALRALLDHAALSPSAVLLGPKVRDWHDERVLVEVGLTIDAAGHRETGLERREYDQGQHDGVRDVLAVGTAGALVRRDVWDEVGGLDPALPVFRDDLDLGWKVNAAGHRVVVVPAARVRHARAATTGRRSTDAAPGRATRTDRRNSLLVLLAHASTARLVALLPLLVLATVLRTLVLLLTRQVTAARDEAGALAAVLVHPLRLRRARRARRAARTVPLRDLRPLFASRTLRLRLRMQALGDMLAGGGVPAGAATGALGDPGPEGPEEQQDLAVGGTGLLRRLLVRPGVVLVLALALVALLAERAVLAPAGGLLSGGRLLPVPAGASDLWGSYAASWHPGAVGSALPASPGVAVLALLSSVLLGKPWLAVDLLLLASVPLAGATAYVAAVRVVRHRVLQLWAAATWALLPVATGAVATGRLDAAAVQVALPLLVLAGGRLLGHDPRVAGWRRAWSLGLGLTLTVALAPQLWPIAAVLLVGGGLLGLLVARTGRRVAALCSLVAAVLAASVPVAALLPWSLEVLRHPTLLVHGPGRLVDDPALVDRALPAWHLPLLAPGGAGLPAVWLTTGLLLAALGGLVRLRRRRLAQAAWATAGLGLLAALALTRTATAVPGTALTLAGWPGVALQVAAAGMLLAALVGADGVRTQLARSSFGPRQLAAVVLAVLAALTPVLAAVGWVARGADGPLRRGVTAGLPAFARADLEADPGLRVLLLRADGAGRLDYSLTGTDGALLGSTEVPPAPAQARLLDDVVADLVTPSGSDAADGLATRAVRYVGLRAGPAAGPLVPVLDAQPGLTRRASGDVLLWQVVPPSAPLTLLPPPVAEAALAGRRAPDRDLLAAAAPVPLPVSGTRADVPLPAGAAGRLLVLAQGADPGWRASVEGVELPRRTAWGWAQAFGVPVSGGHLVLRRDRSERHRDLSVQALVLLVVAVLAAPAARGTRDLEPVDDGGSPMHSARATQGPSSDQPADVGTSTPASRLPGGRP